MSYFKKNIFLFLAFIFFVGGLFFFFEKSNLNPKNTSNIQDEKRKEIVKNVAKKWVKDFFAQDSEEIKVLHLDRLTESNGILGLNETDQFVEEIFAQENKDQITNEQISNYQTYVTPNNSAVIAFAKGKSANQIYKEALNWMWIEDEILNNTSEKWLMPEFFLTQTQNLSTNPIKGRIASDCESQAYTLVSALRAIGVSAENIRVVTGKVNFGNSIGGHAWVEMYDSDNKIWFELEATSGDYYDSKSGKLIETTGLPFEYFKTNQYPSIAKWTMFNDKYFYDVTREQGVAPENWLDSDTISKQDDKNNIRYQLPEKIKKLREERASLLQNKIKNFDKEKLQNKLNEMKKEIDMQSNINITSEQQQKIDQWSAKMKQKQAEIENLLKDGLTNEEWEQIQNDLISLLQNIEQAVMLGMTNEQKKIFQDFLDQLTKIAQQSNMSDANKQKAIEIINNLNETIEKGISSSQKIFVIQMLKNLEKIVLSVETPPAKEKTVEKLKSIINERKR